MLFPKFKKGYQKYILLSGETISEATIQSVCHAEAIINPFSGMETTYQHTKYFKDHLNLIVIYIYHTIL